MTDIVERLRDMNPLTTIACSGEAADTIEALRQRVLAFESLETKRMKDAVTVDDWRQIAQHMEYQWRCCSDGFNKRVGELRQQLATFKNAYAEQVELHNLTLDELAEAQALVKVLRDELQMCAYDEEGFCINPDAAEVLERDKEETK